MGNIIELSPVPHSLIKMFLPSLQNYPSSNIQVSALNHSKTIYCRQLEGTKNINTKKKKNHCEQEKNKHSWVSIDTRKPTSPEVSVLCSRPNRAPVRPLEAPSKGPGLSRCSLHKSARLRQQPALCSHQKI